MPLPIPQLKDIQLPPPIDGFPPALGWWLLAAFVSCMVIMLIQVAYRFYRAGSDYRAAKHLLEKSFVQFRNDHQLLSFASQCQEVLRRYCKGRYPKQTTYSGKQWSDFLKNTSKKIPDDDLLNALSEGLYTGHIDCSAGHLLQFCKHWLIVQRRQKQHLFTRQKGCLQ